MTIETKYQIGDKVFVFTDLNHSYDYKHVEIEDIHVIAWKKGHTAISYKLKDESYNKDERLVFSTAEELIQNKVEELEAQIEKIKLTSKEIK